MRLIVTGFAMMFVMMAGSCDLSMPTLIGVPVETRFAFVNLSRTQYATLALRVHADEDGKNQQEAPFVQTPLLAPGAAYRTDFTELLGDACPNALDLRLYLYRRVHTDVPIGLDEGEAVEPAPVVAGTVENIPACNVQALVTYTVVNWDAPEGVARIKIAQGSEVDQAIQEAGLFPNVDAAWEIEGIEPDLAETPPPAPASNEPIAGRVTLIDGTGVEGVGVLVRTRFRVRLDDADTDNDPDAGFSDPIAFTTTDGDGAFALERPAGAYRLEFFSDDLSFRPAVMDLESPIESIRVIAEPF